MAKKSTDKKLCRTPTPNKKPVQIDSWKYQLIRDRILRIVPNSGEGVAFMELPGMIMNMLSADEQKRLGSIMWYTTAVKLEMEVAGEIERAGKGSPQRLLRK